MAGLALSGLLGASAGTTLTGTAGATPADPTTTPTGSLHLLASNPDSGGPVVVDQQGHGYVAWDRPTGGGHADQVVFCKLPRGGTCGSRVVLPLPGGNNAENEVTAPFPVLGGSPGVVYVVGPRYVKNDVVIWTSHDGGGTFSAGQLVAGPNYPGTTGVDDVLRAPSANPSVDDVSVGSSNPGLGYTLTGPAFVGGPPPHGLAIPAANVAASTIGFAGHTVVDVYWTDTPTPEVRYYWAASPATLASSGWHGPVTVAAGDGTRLASGPGGLFLLSEDVHGPAHVPSRLDLRRWRPATHTFGPPTVIAKGLGSTATGALAIDPATGTVVVAWDGFTSVGDGHVVHVWTSTNAGTSFSGPLEVATISNFFQGPGRLAVVGGQGFLTFRDGNGLELLDLAHL